MRQSLLESEGLTPHPQYVVRAPQTVSWQPPEGEIASGARLLEARCYWASLLARAKPYCFHLTPSRVFLLEVRCRWPSLLESKALLFPPHPQYVVRTPHTVS